MSDEIDSAEQEFNDTWKQLNSSRKTSPFTKVEESMLFSATAFGTLVGTYPTMILVKKMSTR
uniref:Uncharacterized protein n=1 Tax=Setaria digitata TaxID=48799 RepID=A0A915PEN3_9BILA